MSHVRLDQRPPSGWFCSHRRCTPGQGPRWTWSEGLPLILGIYWDNGKENGNYRDYRDYIGVMLGIYWDNGKENANYRGYRDYIRVISILIMTGSVESIRACPPAS